LPFKILKYAKEKKGWGKIGKLVADGFSPTTKKNCTVLPCLLTFFKKMQKREKDGSK
jgi:hypothetical protein